jgi:hypothetical protein
MTHTPEELRRLAEAASLLHSPQCRWFRQDDCSCGVDDNVERYTDAARTAVPELLDALEAAQRDAAEANRQLDWLIEQENKRTEHLR